MPFLSSTPALPVQDIGEAVTFYTERLGFTCAVQTPDFARMVRDAVRIDLWRAGDASWRERSTIERPVRSGAETFLAGTASCRIDVEGIDELYAEYAQSGVLYGPTTVVERKPWGTREFPALDLERNLITLQERT